MKFNYKYKSKPLSYKMWGYFSLFSVMLMILLWFLQTIFLQTFYESMKVREIANTGKEILKKYNADNADEFLNQTSFERGIRVYIVSSDGEIVGGNERTPKRGRSGENNRKISLNKSNLGKAYITEDGYMHMRSVSYVAPLPGDNTKFLYILAPLERLNTTTIVLQNQLIIVMAVSLLISFIVAYFISRHLSRPISNITQSAKMLETGDYNVVFEKGDYKEINELSSALNSAATALSKSDKLRRDLLANVSHDLRTPLTIIKSYAEMIRDISGIDELKRTKHLNVIVEESNRLSELVDDILDLSKLEAGEYTFDFNRFSLSEATEAIIESFVPFADKGYEFITDISNDIYVIGDFHKIKSAIYNLLINSVNYTGDDKKIYVSLKKEGDRARFSVRDTGKGIPSEEIPYVWNRYYRSSNSYKRDKNGSGIGLSIVKMILSAHNAEYGVDSKLHEGSIFWFELDAV